MSSTPFDNTSGDAPAAVIVEQRVVEIKEDGLHCRHRESSSPCRRWFRHSAQSEAIAAILSEGSGSVNGGLAGSGHRLSWRSGSGVQNTLRAIGNR
jgi:hypothetical protein